MYGVYSRSRTPYVFCTFLYIHIPPQAVIMPGLVRPAEACTTVRTVSFLQMQWEHLNGAVSTVLSTLTSARAEDSLKAVCHRKPAMCQQLAVIDRYFATELHLLRMTPTELHQALSSVADAMQSLLHSVSRASAMDAMAIRSAFSLSPTGDVKLELADLCSLLFSRGALCGAEPCTA